MNWKKIRFVTGFFIMVTVFIHMAKTGIVGFSTEHMTLPEQSILKASETPTPSEMIFLALVLLAGLLLMLSGLPVDESRPTVIINTFRHIPMLDDDDEEETHDDEAGDGDGEHHSKKPKEDASKEDVPPKESPKQEGDK